MDAIEAGQLQHARDKVLALLRDNRAGLTLAEISSLTRDVPGIDVYGVLWKLFDTSQVCWFHGAEGTSEVVMIGDPWYHEPKQRVMRKVVLAVLQSHIAGRSRRELAGILLRRDSDCDETYARRLIARMLNEGVLITANGTEIVMMDLVDLNGRTPKLEGAATLNQSPVEQPVTVLRLSATRWLKDAANDT